MTVKNVNKVVDLISTPVSAAGFQARKTLFGWQSSCETTCVSATIVKAAGMVLWVTSILIASDVTAQETALTGARTTPENEIKTVAGSRLLSTKSFGFDIPTANIETTDLKTVITHDNKGESVVSKVHVKVGSNFVVMLPDGQMVGRMAKDIEQTDRRFQPSSQKDLARDVLAGRLSRFSNMNFERSKHYVYLYNTTPAFQKATRGILESMYNGVRAYSKNMGVDVHHPDVPLVVIMFRTQTEFQAYQKMDAGIVAYYDMVSNHIVLCEESNLADTRPDLAHGQLLSTIAHEGAHQILHNIGVQQRLSMWPMWLSEGIAEFFAPTSFGKRNKWKGAGQINDLRMFELETFMQTRYLEGFDGRTINDAVSAARLDSTGYATAWSIVHFLARKKRKKFYQLVAQMSELKPMRGMVDRPGKPVVANLEHFRNFFGDDAQDTETELVKYLGQLSYESPVGDFNHHVGLAIVPTENGKKRFACFFHNPRMVGRWKEQLEQKLTDEQLAAMEWDVRTTRNRVQANNLIKQFLR